MSTLSRQNLKKGLMKTVEGVDFTNTLPKYVTNRRMDGRTDRQTGANLYVPRLSSRGHKRRSSQSNCLFQKPVILTTDKCSPIRAFSVHWTWQTRLQTALSLFDGYIVLIKLKQELSGTKSYEETSEDEKFVVVGHCNDVALKFSVTVKEQQDKTPTMYWLP